VLIPTKNNKLNKCLTVALSLGLFLAFETAKAMPNLKPNGHSRGWWALDLPVDSERPRSDFLAPFFSLMLPSLDQFYESQSQAGAFYLSYALIGYSQMADALAVDDPGTVFSTKNDRVRRIFLGAQMLQTAGSLSAYHSFRSAVATRRPLGEYAFLLHEEDSADLLKAPFHFEFLKRTSTWAILGIEVIALALDFKDFAGKTQFTTSDATYTAAYSYQAGVGEEALFRGWMMPYIANSGWSPWASNLLTSTAFSLAHLSKTNPAPWPQFLLGWYLGQVSLWNDWSIQESIFIHTWWDVLAIGASWATIDANKDAKVHVQLLDLPISL
jgi:hypothetical protein